MRKPARRRVVRTLEALGLLLVVAVLTHPWWLAPLVVHDLASRSGRAVEIDSIRVGLSGSLEPVLHIDGIRIANASWAEAAYPFASLKGAVAVVSWRSVAEWRPVIAQLVLRDGEVDLERQADGLRNWRLRQPDDRGPGRYKVLSIEPHHVTMRFAHRGIGLDVKATGTDTSAAAASPDAMPLHIEFDGVWRQVPFTGRTDSGPVLTFLETGRLFRLRGEAGVRDLHLAVDGRAGDLFRAPALDAGVTLDGTSLAGLAPFIGDRPSTARAFKVEMHVDAASRRYRLSALKAQVGSTDLAGETTWTQAGPRWSMTGELRSASADAADFEWLAGKPLAAPASASASSPSAPAASSAASSASRVAPLRTPTRIDIDLQYTAKRFLADAFAPLQSLAFHGHLEGGAASLSDIDVGLADGHVNGRVAFDPRREVDAAEVDLTLRGLRVEGLMPDAKASHRITGSVSGRLAVKASGASLAAWQQSVHGTASAELANGTIASLLDAEMGLQAGKLVRTLVTGNEPLPLPCAAASVDVRQGGARIHTLVIASANTRSIGAGVIDLRGETLDVLLTPQAMKPGIDLQKSIHLHGPLLKPERSLVDRVEPRPVSACPAMGR